MGGHKPKYTGNESYDFFDCLKALGKLCADQAELEGALEQSGAGTIPSIRCDTKNCF